MFAELLKRSEDMTPSEQQYLVEREFPDVVRASAVHLWRPGDPISGMRQRLVVGVATYSVLDLMLLDRLETHARRHTESLRVDVFNTLDCRRHEDFQDYIPGLGDVYHTPVAGLWESGQFVAGGSGRHAIDIINRSMARE
jgi:hypothetical protein